MRPRKTVSALASALVSIMALSVCASPASADPLSMTFTEARANVGVQLSDEALFAAPAIAPFDAQIDPESGSITKGVLEVPEFSTHITEPIVADVTVDFEIGVITGSFDPATGALMLKGRAGGILTANNETYEGEECIVSTTPAILELTTAGNSGGLNPRSGQPFTAGLTGPGAIAGQWADMQAAPVDMEDSENVSFCQNVDKRIGEDGGIWLDQEGDLTPPPAPQLTSTDPASPSLSGTPRIRGAAETGSTVRVYAGSGCTGTPVATDSAAALGSPGLEVAVAEGVTADFSASATDAAGNTSACSASISYTRLKHVDPVVTCIVPKLAGKTLKAAKKGIRAANCTVGKVHKPKPRKGKRLGPLVVKSSTPSAGTTLAAGSTVNLRLGPLPRKAHTS